LRRAALVQGFPLPDLRRGRRGAPGAHAGAGLGGRGLLYRTPV